MGWVDGGLCVRIAPLLRPGAQVQTYTECLNLCDNSFPYLRGDVGGEQEEEKWDLTYFQMTSDWEVNSTWAAAYGYNLGQLEKPNDQKPKIKFTRRNKSGEEKQTVSLQDGGRAKYECFVCWWFRVSLVVYSGEEE